MRHVTGLPDIANAMGTHSRIAHYFGTQHMLG